MLYKLSYLYNKTNLNLQEFRSIATKLFIKPSPKLNETTITGKYKLSNIELKNDLQKKVSASCDCRVGIFQKTNAYYAYPRDHPAKD